YIDMMGPHHAFHGEQIAVATVAMARLQDRMLADPPSIVAPTAITRDDVVRRFGPVHGEACWREFAHKRLDREAADAVNARLTDDWPDIRDRISRVTLGAVRITAALAAAGAPCEPADLGWSPALFADAFAHAREIRDRYTFLDLAGDRAR